MKSWRSYEKKTYDQFLIFFAFDNFQPKILLSISHQFHLAVEIYLLLSYMILEVFCLKILVKHI